MANINVVSTIQLTEADVKDIIKEHIKNLGYDIVGDFEFKMDYSTEKIGGGRFDLRHRKATLGITPITIQNIPPVAATVDAPKITAPSGK